MDTNRMFYRRGASRITLLAHLFGVLAIILLLIWLLHYREGINYDSDNGYRVFNLHPLMMFMGFVFFAGQAMMAYHTVPADRSGQKMVHMFLHLTAIVLGIVGLCAVFKFHDMDHIPDVYTLHSWIGISTFTLYCLQWLVGFVVFMLQGSTTDRARIVPWHIAAGRALLYMAIATALTGLMEKYHFLRLDPYARESYLINFTGLSILLFGVFVDLSVGLSHYV